MKRHLFVGLVALSLIPGVAHAVTIGVGAFGGTSIPVLQVDNGRGSTFGLRVPVNFVPLLTVEPFFAKTSGGEKTQTLGPLSYTFPGIDVTSYGANELFAFGTGFQMYPFAGVSSNNLKGRERKAAQIVDLDATRTGYDFGLGFGAKLPLVGLSAHARGAFNIVIDPAGSRASRKWTDITVGVSYSLFHFPPLVP